MIKELLEWSHFSNDFFKKWFHRNSKIDLNFRVIVSEYNSIVLNKKYSTIKCKLYNYYSEIFLEKNQASVLALEFLWVHYIFIMVRISCSFFSRQNWLVLIVKKPGTQIPGYNHQYLRPAKVLNIQTIIKL